MDFIRPKYCRQPKAADCWHCSLGSYGKNCRGKSIAAVQSGMQKTEKKAAASRKNGAAGGRPVNPESKRQRRKAAHEKQ